MRRITSIRPGEAFQSSFGAYPASELLVDVLRSNLTGALEVDPPPVAATVYFREGVPVAVRSAGADPRGLLTGLVGEGAGPFRFLEGQGPPADVTRAILRPLQLLFEGLSRPSAEAQREAFLARHARRRLRLADTYPLGADPLGLGPERERLLHALTESRSLDELLAEGEPREVVGAALLTLRLAEMVTFEGEGSAPRSHPVSERPLEAMAPPVPEPGPSAQWALMLDEGPEAAAPSAMPSIDVNVPGHAEVIEALRAERAEIARSVDPLRGKDYLDILRVKPDTKPDQLERSRSYLGRHLVKEEGPGADAVRALLQEAFEVLTDPSRGPEYRKLAKNATTQKTLRKRQAFEAPPKLARLARALAAGELAQASYLYDWAKALDPELPELEGHRLFLDFCTRPRANKPEFASSIRGAMEQVVERCPGNLSLRFYLVILYVAMGEAERALSCFDGVSHAEEHALHPLAKVAVSALG